MEASTKLLPLIAIASSRSICLETLALDMKVYGEIKPPCNLSAFFDMAPSISQEFSLQ